MLVRQYAYPDWSLLRWLTLFALASALTLALLTSSASGQNATDPPGVAPPAFDVRAEPPQDAETADLGVRVRGVFELHRSQQHDAAIAAWQSIELPCVSEVWKLVALGRSYLATGQLDEAARVLEVADRGWPEQPVVQYCLGLLRLEQAYLARDWPDAQAPGVILLASQPAPQISPNSRGMYMLAAMRAFEESIRHEESLDLGDALIPLAWPSRAASKPTAGDLLRVLGAENYVGDAHRQLGLWYLDRGALEQAEQHLDAATSRRMRLGAAYLDLGKSYETLNMPVDAARAYLKALQQQGQKLGPALKALENLRRAWNDIL